MKTKEFKRYKVILNPELKLALRGYTPEFGNLVDQGILKRLSKLNGAIVKVDNEVLRGLKRNGTFNTKMREILTLEKSLVAEITRRNLDF